MRVYLYPEVVPYVSTPGLWDREKKFKSESRLPPLPRQKLPTPLILQYSKASNLAIKTEKNGRREFCAEFVFFLPRRDFCFERKDFYGFVTCIIYDCFMVVKMKAVFSNGCPTPTFRSIPPLATRPQNPHIAYPLSHHLAVPSPSYQFSSS